MPFSTNWLYLLKPFFALLLCVSVLAVKAQNKKIDSLTLLIAKEKSDTARLSLSIKKAKLISNQNIDSSIYYGIKNVQEALRIKYYKGEFNARNALATYYLYKGDFAAAASQLQQLERVVKPSKDSVDIAIVYSNYGMMYGMRGIYDTSIALYKKSLRIKEKNKDSTELGSTYSNISIGYQQLGNFATSLLYLQKALTIAERRKNESAQAYALLNMGITYDNIGDTVKAEASYFKGNAIATRLGLPVVQIYAYTNLASLYIGGNKWKEGYDYAMKAVPVAEKMGDQGMVAINLAKAAMCLVYLKEYDKAYKMAAKAILISDSTKQPLSISQAQQTMGTLFFKQKKHKQAIPYYERSFSVLGNNFSYINNTSQTRFELSACYENTGNYVKALSNYKTGAEIADSVKRKDNIRKATELSMNYDFDKKQELLAAEKKQDNELAQTKQKALLAALVFVLLLGVVAFAGYRNKQKANKVLVEQKKKIETTLAELKLTQAQLIQSEKMASLGELTAGIAHEIQNPLNFVNNFSELSNELMDEMKEELNNGAIDETKLIADDIKQNLQKINHHGKRADAIVKGMLQHSRQTKGVKEPTDINALAEESLRLSYHGLRAKDKSFSSGIKTEFDDNVGMINIVPEDIRRVLLNLCNNAFYAVKPNNQQNAEEYKPLVTVSTKRLSLPSGKAVLEVTIADNGSGMPPNIVDKIFQPFFTTKPTGQGTGLGLSLAYDIITREHQGTITVNTKEGNGTMFTIELPV